MSEDFYGKCILISGAAGAVGRTLVKQMEQECVKLILVDLPSTEKSLEKMASRSLDNECEIREENQKKLQEEIKAEIFWYTADICIMDDITELITQLNKHGHDVDVLINAAGINHPVSARLINESIWDEVIDTNLKGIFFLTQEIANYSLLKNQGVVVNIASQHGIIGNENRAHYCASKSGVIGMTRALACEWAKYKVRVNCVSPTFILTERNESYLNNPYSKLEYMNKIPLGEYALPEDVADGVIFLAGSKSRMITGHNLVIDGGYTIV